MLIKRCKPVAAQHIKLDYQVHDCIMRLGTLISACWIVQAVLRDH